MRIVALMPMKAHSERVPGKNFRSLHGRPLYRWMLDTLLSVEEILSVVINTDVPQRFAADARNERILIRRRRPEVCGDMVSMNLVLADDIEAVTADAYVMTHSTNPLISATTVREAIRRYSAGLAAGSNDSLFSVNRVQGRFYRGDGSAINHDPDRLLRTQDLEPWYEENSCLYVFSAASFRLRQTRIGAHPVLFETPKRESFDIDTEEDWSVVEAVAMATQRGGAR